MARMALAKTEDGQRAFKERSPMLSVRQRSAFIQFDGVKSIHQVLAACAGLGVTQADVDQMMVNGFLADNAQPVAVAAPSAAPAAVPVAVRSVTLSNTPAAAPAASPPGTPVGSPSPVASSPTALTNQQRYAQAWPIATQLTASLGLRGFRLNLSVESVSGYDDLLALFPKIQAAVGADKAAGLERALKG
jgi:hypothetical protein